MASHGIVNSPKSTNPVLNLPLRVAFELHYSYLLYSTMFLIFRTRVVLCRQERVILVLMMMTRSCLMMMIWMKAGVKDRMMDLRLTV